MPISRDGKLVAEISLQNSVFDEHGFLRRLAFVVDVERSAPPRHGAVVDHRALFAGYAFADQAGECRSLLAVEVGFQSVTHGLVQQHARPSRAEHNFHLAGGSFASVELQDRLPRGFFGEEFRSLLAEEEVESYASAAARRSARGVSFSLRDARDVHARQRLRIFRESPVRADHQNVPQFVGVAGPDFLNSCIVGARGFVGTHDQFDFGADLGIY